jgi:serine/threonine protein kinase/Flp pilus assembly protein TadD
MTASRPDNEAIFHAARAIPDPDRRREYVRQACGGDEARIAQIEALLAAADAPDSLLDRPAAGTPVATIDQPATEGPGTVIGPYKLIKPIGEGGMGAVWMAQQTEPVKRLVAVKLIKAGMDTRQVIARFEAERQALALMDHPNVARVLDGGTSSAGRPYFVMDLVKGVPITRYCDEHHLTPRQRLELFIPVCQAIQHAHQKGIIRRDLKPSNVLVAPYDGKAVVKVIDFGMAKAAGQQLTDRTLVTGFGAVVGTLEYMSPEQAELNNHDIDTRSDIYALGVLLYELLAGSPPFSRKELAKAGMVELLRVIREQEPSKPSAKLSTAEGLPTLAANRGTEPAKLTRLVRGELDWIVMKALEKDRGRRYETANGFAMDVQRYLADEPVLACPPSLGYRLRKFTRRNKGGLAVAALVLFFLVLLGSGVGWALRDRSAREAEAARQQIERQAKVAGQVESILGEVDRLEKEQQWSEALEAVRRAEAAVAGGEADPATAERVRQRLRDLAFIDRLEQIRIEEATLVEGKSNRAGADRDYARAFRAYGVDVDELPVEMSIDRLRARPVLAVALAAALDDWVLGRRLVAEADVARWKRLVAVARGIDPEPLRDRLRATWGQPVANVRDDLRRLAESIDVRAQHPATLFILARTLAMVALPDSAMRILWAAQSLHPGDFWLNMELGHHHLVQRNDQEGAVRFYTAAVAIRPQSGIAHGLLGALLIKQKKFDEAIALYRKAIELDPKLDLAHVNFGYALYAKGLLDEAIAEGHKALELVPKNANARNRAHLHNNLGNALAAKGRVDEAILEFKKAIELDPKNAPAHNGLGTRLRVKGRVDEAIAEYKKAIELDPRYATPHTCLGNALLEDKGRVDEAIAECQKAIELDPKLAIAHNNLGNALGAKGHVDGAIARYKKAIELDPKWPFPTTTSATPCTARRSCPRPSLNTKRPSNSTRNSPPPTTASATSCATRRSSRAPSLPTAKRSNSTRNSPAHTAASATSCVIRGSWTRPSPSTARPLNSTRKTPGLTTTWVSSWPTRRSCPRPSKRSARPLNSTLRMPLPTSTSASPCTSRRSWTRPSLSTARPSNSIRNSSRPTTTSATSCATRRSWTRPSPSGRRPSNSTPNWLAPTTISATPCGTTAVWTRPSPRGRRSSNSTPGPRWRISTSAWP